MKKEMISKAISGLDDRFIAEAADNTTEEKIFKKTLSGKKIITWKSWAVAVACLAIVAATVTASFAGRPKVVQATDAETGYLLPEDAIITSYRQESEHIAEGWYAYNERGETYGSMSAAPALEAEGKELDLYITKNEEGAVGFIRLAEKSGVDLNNRYDAFNYKRTQNVIRVVNLYECDGKTVIGSYTLGEGEISYETFQEAGQEGEASHETIGFGMSIFRYGRTTVTREPYGTFEMADDVEAEGKKLDLILTSLWKTEGGKEGLFRQSDLGCDCHSLQEFEAWVAALKEPITVNVYDEMNPEIVVDQITFGK